MRFFQLNNSNTVERFPDCFVVLQSSGVCVPPLAVVYSLFLLVLLLLVVCRCVRDRCFVMWVQNVCLLMSCAIRVLSLLVVPGPVLKLVLGSHFREPPG